MNDSGIRGVCEKALSLLWDVNESLDAALGMDQNRCAPINGDLEQYFCNGYGSAPMFQEGKYRQSNSNFYRVDVSRPIISQAVGGYLGVNGVLETSDQ